MPSLRVAMPQLPDKPAFAMPSVLASNVKATTSAAEKMASNILQGDLNSQTDKSDASLNVNSVMTNALLLPRTTPVSVAMDETSPRALFVTSGETAASCAAPISQNNNLLDVKSDMAATALLPTRPTKPFPCQYPGCNRSFEKANLLRRHAKLHSGDCKFICDVCKKCFESQSKQDDHYRKHTGEKPFQCHVCGNTFRYKGDRTKHLKNIHGVVMKSDSTPQTSHSPMPLSAGGGGDNSTDGVSFVHFTTGDETNSSISSLQSSVGASDGGAGAAVMGSVVTPAEETAALQAANGTHVIKVELPASAVALGSPPAPHANHETVTMSLDEVMQFAQPTVADFY